jgi:hypothetical protein
MSYCQILAFSFFGIVAVWREWYVSGHRIGRAWLTRAPVASFEPEGPPYTGQRINMDEWLDFFSEGFIFPMTILLIGGGMEAGAMIARRWRTHPAGDADRFLATLASPSIGLLALMIGFTFSMALARFDSRRSAVLSEANAIGTAALRGRLLPEPYRSTVAPLFKEYAMLRVAKGRENVASSATKDAIRRSLDIQEGLWRAGMEAASENSHLVPSGLFLQALNVMIDVHEERVTAARNEVPSVVFVMLDGIAMIAFGFAGHGLQLADARFRGGMWIMAAMVGTVIMLVVDLDRPQAGIITVSQQPLLDFIDSTR